MVENLKCMYCAEMGVTNPNVFIEIVDVELGAGWICKECFIESEKEKDEHLKELEDQLQAKEQECEELKYRLKKIAEFRHDYCMNCEDLLKPTHSCCGCNMSILRHLIEEQI